MQTTESSQYLAEQSVHALTDTRLDDDYRSCSDSNTTLQTEHINMHEKMNRYGKQMRPITVFHSVKGGSRSMEVSVHACGKAFLRELEPLLPGIDLTNMLVIPTMQHSSLDLVKIGDPVEAEKDFCLEVFMDFASTFCKRMIECNHFADYVDPCSGLVMLTKDANKVFSEVDSAQQLLGYAVQNCGCCKVLLHPKWGSAVYPASIFTTAPMELVNQILDNLFQIGVNSE